MLQVDVTCMRCGILTACDTSLLFLFSNHALHLMMTLYVIMHVAKDEQ